MKRFSGYMRGVGIGGWLTNYKRLRFIPEDLSKIITEGDRIHFDTYITEADIAQIASWGCDHIRFPFDYLILEDDDRPGEFKSWGFDLLDRGVAWCKANGLNVVFDLHRAAGASCEYPGEVLLDGGREQERFIGLWREMARHYRGEGRNVAFELLNEITSANSEKWNALAARAIAAIREIDPERIIVVGCNCYNSPGKLAELAVHDDPNVVYTFHCYDPCEFTHQRAVIIPVIAAYNRYLQYPGDIEAYRSFRRFAQWDVTGLAKYERMGREYLYASLQPARDFVQRHDRALYCGEFGVIRHADLKSRENYYRDVIEFCAANGIAFSAWNYLSAPYDANRFSLVDDWDRRPLSPELIRIIGGK